MVSEQQQVVFDLPNKNFRITRESFFVPDSLNPGENQKCALSSSAMKTSWVLFIADKKT